MARVLLILPTATYRAPDFLEAAAKLGVEVVMVGTSQRSAVWSLQRGTLLESLVRDLPAETRVWICN